VKICIRAIVLFWCLCLSTYSQGNSFDRVRYNGGSVDSKSRSERVEEHSDCNIRLHHVIAEGRQETTNTSQIGHVTELRAGGASPRRNHDSVGDFSSACCVVWFVP
jgi:hypothetical protein